MFDRIMALSPWIETGIRTAYWRSAWLRALLARLQHRGTTNPQTQSADPDALAQIIAGLQDFGVGPGDILIVHSDLTLLHRLGLRPAAVNAALLALLGPEGTLVMPAYPLIAGEPKGPDRLRADVSQLRLRYDPKRTPLWTGLLPHALMRLPGARRSALPINSLVAVGRHADAMFARELEGDRPLPCGRQSAWFYCYEHGAKMVGLGIDLPHSLTMNHVAEDAFAEQWPVAGWYRDRSFEIVLPNGRTIEKCIGERHPRWALNYAERTLAKDLRRAGILRESDISGVHMEFASAREHIGFLNARKTRHYPYFIFPFQKRA